MPLILGSTSPRRKAFLELFSLPFIQTKPLFDESSLPFNGTPEQHALQLAEKKAQSLAPFFPKDPILTADTLVYHDGKLCHQPKNPQEAFHTLQNLSGKTHVVWTAMAFYYQGVLHPYTECAYVTLASLSPLQIVRYQKMIHAYDKAGGYAIQGVGSLIVEKIEGSPSTVAGFSLIGFEQLLREIGYDLWNYTQTIC